MQALQGTSYLLQNSSTVQTPVFAGALDCLYRTVAAVVVQALENLGTIVKRLQASALFSLTGASSPMQFRKRGVRSERPAC